MGNLLPCPFCGSQKAEVVQVGEQYAVKGSFVVLCFTAGCVATDQIAKYKTKQDAESAWNTRAHPTAPLRVKLPKQAFPSNWPPVFYADEMMAALKTAEIEVEP